MSATGPAPLAGRGIVITRPAAEAARMADLIVTHGGEPVLAPAIDIAEPVNAAALEDTLRRLDEFDVAVFVSPAAVRRGLAAVASIRGSPATAHWPPALRVIALAAGTARRLLDSGFAEVLTPPGGRDSEALLELSELSELRGRRVLLFRGEGGRTLIAEVLAARGAQISHAVCYRRVAPQFDREALLGPWRRGRLHAVLFTSTEAFSNFVDGVGPEGLARLRSTPVFVVHERIARVVREHGVAEVVSGGPRDEDMLEALVAYFSAKH